MKLSTLLFPDHALAGTIPRASESPGPARARRTGRRRASSCALVASALLSAASPVVAASWYVDGALARSGDGTSWQRAWRSFANVKWAQLRPGDTLYVSGGKTAKVYTTPLVVGASGADGQPITVTGGVDSGHDGKVILDGRMRQPSGVVLESAEHVVVRGLVLRDFLEEAVRIHDSRDVLAEGSTIHAPARGFHILRSSDVTIRGNTVTSPSFVDLQTDGIYSQDNSRNRYERNTIVISNAETEGHDDGIQSYRDTDIEVVGNYVEQRNPKTYNAQGIFMVDARGTMLAVNNIVYAPNTRNGLLTLLNQSGTGGVLLAYNNTLVGSQWGVIQIQDVPGARIFNNILYTTAPNGAGITITGALPPPGNIDHNLYFTPNGAPAYLVGGDHQRWQDWRARGYEPNGVEGEPRFVDLTARKFTLSAASPAIDAGKVLDLGHAAPAATRARPPGDRPDLGAQGPVGAPTAGNAATR